MIDSKTYDEITDIIKKAKKYAPIYSDPFTFTQSDGFKIASPKDTSKLIKDLKKYHPSSYISNLKKNTPIEAGFDWGNYGESALLKLSKDLKMLEDFKNSSPGDCFVDQSYGLIYSAPPKAQPINMKIHIKPNTTKYWIDGPKNKSVPKEVTVYKNCDGQKHCEDGPAVIYSDGTCEYYLCGKKMQNKQIYFEELHVFKSEIKNKIDHWNWHLRELFREPGEYENIEL